MVSRGGDLEPRAEGAPVPVGELVSRLVSEGKELMAVEVARGKALAATRGKLAARAGGLALAAAVLAVVAVGSLAAAAAIGLAALGLALGWAAAVVGAALALTAIVAGMGVRRSAGRILQSGTEQPRAQLRGDGSSHRGRIRGRAPSPPAGTETAAAHRSADPSSARGGAS
jgi:hypothetical protein